MQDEDRSFRLNVPPDAWPAVATPPQPPLDTTRQATIDRLTQTMRGSDPAAFELAVCDAFAQLGFSATHVGGNDGPDGYADAQLGPLGYRAMLECKSGARDVSSPDCVAVVGRAARCARPDSGSNREPPQCRVRFSDERTRFLDEGSMPTASHRGPSARVPRTPTSFRAIPRITKFVLIHFP